MSFLVLLFDGFVSLVLSESESSCNKDSRTDSLNVP